MHLDDKSICISKVRLAIIDVETTGLDPAEHELIGLSLYRVEVDSISGDLLQIVDCYSGQREPTKPFPPDLDKVIGMSEACFAGKEFDISRIREILIGCELLIGHNASFDRAFLAPHVSFPCQCPWACSLTDIDWFNTEQQTSASVDHLLSFYKLKASSGTSADDCRALIEILARPLPVSGHTGFSALMESARLKE